jgi:outer membrane receptor protein involved in Fe transport
MRPHTARRRSAFLATTALGLVFATSAWAQNTQDAQAAPATESVVVTGTQIIGSKITGALPVTVVDEGTIAAVAPLSGDDLVRSIPQMGATNFNSSTLPGSSNSARGDIGSIDLRNIGEGATLLLVNGRRVVGDPRNQASIGLLAPTTTYNSNAIPISDAQRMEVLLDGAAALYGSDAIAGVVNVITNKDMNGLKISVQHGAADGTNFNSSSIDLLGGMDFAGGKGNVTASFNLTQQTALFTRDQYFSASSDKTPLFANVPTYAGVASLNGTSTTTPFGTFTLIPASTVKSGATTLTTASGQFHIQPATDAGCVITPTSTTSGNCLATGTLPTSTTAANTRADSNANYPVTITPSINRYNFFSNAHYDLTPGITLYAEAGWYQAETTSLQPPGAASGSSTVTVPASNYWNPFGPTTFANGTANPNRIAGLNISAAGAAAKITTLSFADQGTNVIRDHTHQSRILIGAKGDDLFGFNWDTAVLYSEAGNRDVGEGIDETKLQANLALSTPAAYNPFLGGNPSNPGGPVTNASNQAALQTFTNYVTTDNYSTLGLADFKVSKADLFSLPAGDLGLAAGVEVRHEYLADIRDPNINGTNQFTDSVTGTTIVSNELGVSQTPSSSGDRWVESVYGEFGVPVISPEMGIPLVQKVDLQIAGRFENFSDVGGVFKPKVAFSWDVTDDLRIRGSWAQGFEAPNLIQEHEKLLSRSNTNTDYIYCQADLNAGRINSFANCSESVPLLGNRSGNANLRPETSDSKSIGFVFQPSFIPAEYGNFTATADYWSILEKNLIGVFGQANAMVLDYLLRVQGSSNPNVLRAAPTSSQIAQFAGTGIAPAGTVLSINDQYVNENPQLASGIDLGAHWDLRDTSWGNFSVDANVARQLSLKLEPSPVQQSLLDARSAGIINAGTTITGFGNLLQQGTNPIIKWTVTPTWNYGPWTIGGLVSYTGSFYETGLINTSNVPFKVSPFISGNVYGDVAFKDTAFGSDAHIRVGVRDVSNAAPPLYGSGYGFVAGLYEPTRRFEYVNLTVKF